MKDKVKGMIEKMLFTESNNKEEIINNCNKILDAKGFIDAKVEKSYNRTQRRFVIISIACLVFIVALAMAVFIPPVFKNNEPGTYYFNQSGLRWEDVNDVEKFIDENNVSIKRLADNLNNTGKICYYKDTYVGLLQELVIISEKHFEMGTVFICKSNFVIKDNEEKIFDKVTVAGIIVDYLSYENAEEHIYEFSFLFNEYKYIFIINSLTDINLEYYVKQIVE